MLSPGVSTPRSRQPRRVRATVGCVLVALAVAACSVQAKRDGFRDALVAEHLGFEPGDYGSIVFLSQDQFAVVLRYEEKGWVVPGDRDESSVAIGTLDDGSGEVELVVEREVRAPGYLGDCDDVNILDVERNSAGDVLVLDECRIERRWELTVGWYRPGAERLEDPQVFELEDPVHRSSVVGNNGGQATISAPPERSSPIVYAVGANGCSALAELGPDGASVMDLPLGDGDGQWNNVEYEAWEEGIDTGMDCVSDGAANLPDSCGESLVAAVGADLTTSRLNPHFRRGWEIRLFDSYEDPRWAESRALVGEVRWLTMLEASASCRYVTFSGEVDGTLGLFVVRVEDGEMVRVSPGAFRGADIDEDSELLIATASTGGVAWSDGGGDDDYAPFLSADFFVSGIWAVDLEAAFSE